MLLSAQNIYKKYGDLEVLRGIDLLIESAEIVAITGSSGAGKSTLLHIIGTLDKADSGTITINNKNISSFRNTEMGFVFQFHHLLTEFTALENVMLPALIAGKKESEAKKYASELLERLGLIDRKDSRPNTLSGGEAQRVAVCRALINQPSIILADEPSGNLDSVNALELHQLFFQLRKDLKQTFIIVTHNEELATMADRKIILKDGKVID